MSDAMSTLQLVGRRKAVTALLTVAVLALVAATAFAYESFYGGYSICGSPVGNCYVQSDPGHTYVGNSGGAGGATSLTCQLFNSGGVNEVSHGYGGCNKGYSGGQYVTGRVYNKNQAGYSDVVYGWAHT
jgi:hypothetical protein